MAYVENILEIYKTEYSKYEKTREVQWKMNIAIWTLIAAVGYAFAKGEVTIDNKSLGFTSILSLAIITVHCAFLIQVQNSLDRSLDRMRNIGEYIVKNEGKAEETVLEIITWNNIEKKHPRKMKAWVLLQTAVTLILLTTVWLLADQVK